jgi:5-methylcytosine-specific restriction endonuclease McrA
MYRGDEIDALQVFENHNWICHICEGIIDRELRHPSPKSATLDHVIELRNGGTHTWDNVVPAHKDCNERRSLV